MSSKIIKTYTSKIIRAPALLKDTKIFLSHCDEGLSVEENIRQAAENNLFGRPARSYVKQFLQAFRERYLFGDDRDKALHTIIRKGRDEAVVNRILYYHTALTDPLLYDVVTLYVYERHSRGQTQITVPEVQQYIRRLSEQGKTTTPWSDNVCNRVARNILTTLRDFLILEGGAKKRIAPVHLPLQVFVYVAFQLNRTTQAGEKILSHPDWKLFLLNRNAVERLFLEAHQQKLLHFEAAGKIIRIEYPYRTVQEVVDAIIH